MGTSRVLLRRALEAEGLGKSPASGIQQPITAGEVSRAPKARQAPKTHPRTAAAGSGSSTPIDFREDLLDKPRTGFGLCQIERCLAAALIDSCIAPDSDALLPSSTLV